ncbi:hypothetical protein RIR_jg4389.t1 [Rhizophagus irregularis DAOM 181602=DAOM 197198]|nr:hypothetical protein RIR_jg4389.t1 [Rhizophagus irregularis DAOM 181602=DAOM 197198]
MLPPFYPLVLAYDTASLIYLLNLADIKEYGHDSDNNYTSESSESSEYTARKMNENTSSSEYSSSVEQDRYTSPTPHPFDDSFTDENIVITDISLREPSSSLVLESL